MRAVDIIEKKKKNQELSKEEIDFSQPEEKEFLMREGFPKILARFFA